MFLNDLNVHVRNSTEKVENRVLPPTNVWFSQEILGLARRWRSIKHFLCQNGGSTLWIWGFFVYFFHFFFFFSLCMWGEWLLWKNVLSHQLSIKAKLSVSWDENYTLWAMRKTEESLTWYVNVRRDYDVMLLWGACYGNKFYYLVTFLVRKSLCSCLWRSTFSKR